MSGGLRRLEGTGGSDNHVPFWDAGAEARNDDLPIGRLDMPSSSLLPPSWSWSWSWSCSWAPGVSFQAPSAGGGGQQGVLGGLLPEKGSRRGSPDVEILPAWTRRGPGGHTLALLAFACPSAAGRDGRAIFFSSQVCGIPGGARGRRGWLANDMRGEILIFGGPAWDISKVRAPGCPPLRSRQQGMAMHEGGVWTATAGQGDDPEASALGLGRRDGNVMSGVHVQVAGRGGNLALLSRLARLLDIPPGPRATRHADRAKFPVTHTSIGPPKCRMRRRMTAAVRGSGRRRKMPALVGCNVNPPAGTSETTTHPTLVNLDDEGLEGELRRPSRSGGAWPARSLPERQRRLELGTWGSYSVPSLPSPE